MKEPLISVLIPTYNREKYIKQAIDSVIAQDYRPIEIIVVDDGSTDGTKEIVKKYDKSIVKYFYQKNKGIPGARNACLSKAKGEYIAWLDSDDYYLPGKLTAQMNYMRKHPDCEIVFTKYENFLESKEVKNNKIAMDMVRREKEVEYKTYLMSSLAKKSFYEKVGEFPEKYKISEDDFILGIARNLKINLDNFISKIFYKRRIHGDNSLILNDATGNLSVIGENLLCDGLRNFVKGKNTSSTPAVSIIVPIYNTEPYLKRCLDSLINQTLKNIEIILINDCSPDNSWALMQEYAKKDDRIVLINHKVNKGVSVARNDGMKVAKGEYVGFVDSDDYVDLDFYETLYNNTENGKIDVVKGEIKVVGIDEKEMLVKINDLIKKNKFYFNSFFTTAICRKSLIEKNNISFFTRCTNGEDLEFIIKVVYHSKSVKTVDGKYYYYIKNKNSNTNNPNEYKIKCYVSYTKRMLSFMNKIDIKRDDYAILLTSLVDIILDFYNMAKSVKFNYLARDAFCSILKKVKKEHRVFIMKNLCINEDELEQYFKNKNFSAIDEIIKKYKQRKIINYIRRNNEKK